MLGRHLDGLAARSRRIVHVAASLGDGAAIAGGRRTGATELEVVEALDEVADGRLVDIDPIGGAYRFVHDLARLTVIAGVGPDFRTATRHLRSADPSAPWRMNV